MFNLKQNDLMIGLVHFHRFWLSDPIKIFEEKVNRVALNMRPPTGMFWLVDSHRRVTEFNMKSFQWESRHVTIQNGVV